MQRNRHVISQYYRSELPESPIKAPSQQEDYSPEPENFLYPASYQPAVNVPRHLNLKIQVTNLLSQLKDWLIQLCLSEHCVTEVEEQLGPIIYEMIELGEQEDSYWVQTFNCRDNSLKESHNAFVNSGVSEEGKNISLFINQNRTQVALLGQGEKNLVRMYFRKYYRLFENCMARIKRLSGQKKLKFLVDTTVKNIFSQTLRVSYHLKVVEHKLNEQKQIKIDRNRNGQLRVLAQRTRSILLERGNVRYSFRRMKVSWIEGCKRDGVFVHSMLGNITKLCSLYEKNKRWGLTNRFFNWRQSALQLKIKEEQTLVQLVRSMSEDMLVDIQPLTSLNEFKDNWRNTIENQFGALIDSLFCGQECVFMSMEALMRQPRLQKNCSIFSLLEQDSCFTHRSKQWKQYPYIGQFSLEELKNCIVSGQIYRNEHSNSNLLLVPVKSVPGVLFVSLAQQPNNSLSFSKTPMSLRSFRRLLRVVQLSSPLLEQMGNLCRRVQEQWQQVDSESHYRELFREFIKTDLIIGSSNEGHLQVSQRGGEAIQIDSHRLQSPSGVISQVMQRFGLTSLMIYHRDSIRDPINEIPCIIVGSQQLSMTQKCIIRSMDQQLISSGKETLIVNRNGRSYMVMPLRQGKNNIGLIHCVVGEQKVDAEVISECLVPLLMRYQGKIQCEQCQVRVTLPQFDQLMNQSQKNSEKSTITFAQSLKLVTASDISQLQSLLSNTLNSKGHFFSKLLLKIDIKDSLNYFYTTSTQLNFLTLDSKEQICHNQTVIQDFRSLSYADTFGKIVHNYPCFDNIQLHLYENDNINSFRLIAVPVKRSGEGVFGYWLVGHYLQPEEDVSKQRIIKWVKQITDRMSMNSIFKNTKISELKSLLQNNKDEPDINQKRIIQKLNQWKGQGKLLKQVQQFSQEFKQDFQVVLGKVNNKNELISIHQTIKEQKRKCFLSSENCKILETNAFFSSHEKVISYVYRTSKSKHNRTIRPVDPRRLDNDSIFIPAMSASLRLQLIEKIKQMYQLEGWVSTNNLTDLTKISKSLTGNKNNEDKLIQMVSVGNYNEQRYLAMIIRGLQAETTSSAWNSQILLKTVAQKYSQIIKNSASLLPSQLDKQKAILNLCKMVSYDVDKINCINQFKANRLHFMFKTHKFVNTLSKFLSPVIHKQRIYLKNIQQGFVAIGIKSTKICDIYKCGAWRILPIIQKVMLRSNYQSGFDQIRASASTSGFDFEQISGTNRMSQTLNQLVKEKLKYCLSVFELYSQHKKNNAHISKLLALQKIHHLYLKVQSKNTKHLFKQKNILSDCFSNNLSLIGQQFSKLTFNNRQNFLRYANERFDTVLKHLEYALVKKIQVMCCLKIKDGWMVYKIDQNQTYKEYKQKGNLNEEGRNCQIVQAEDKKQAIVFKGYTKNNWKATQQMAAIKQVIIKGLLPCYSKYLSVTIAKTKKVAATLLSIFCKQLWNGSCSEPQKIYAFGGDKSVEEQAMKLHFIGRLKAIKQQMNIVETKLIANAISTESKTLYNLEYEHSAICGLLAGTYSPGPDDSSVLSKYGEVVTRQQLSKEREELERLEQSQQGKTLNYQIKSKTFATSKIITFLQKRTNAEVESSTYNYLKRNKENKFDQNCLEDMEKVVVEKKLGLNELKDRIKKQNKQQKKTASRALWLTMSRLIKSRNNKEVDHSFRTLLLPRRPSYRA